MNSTPQHNNGTIRQPRRDPFRSYLRTVIRRIHIHIWKRKSCQCWNNSLWMSGLLMPLRPIADCYRMATGSDSATKRTPIYIDSFPPHLDRNTYKIYNFLPNYPPPPIEISIVPW